MSHTIGAVSHTFVNISHTIGAVYFILAPPLLKTGPAHIKIGAISYKIDTSLYKMAGLVLIASIFGTMPFVLLFDGSGPDLNGNNNGKRRLHDMYMYIKISKHIIIVYVQCETRYEKTGIIDAFIWHKEKNCPIYITVE